jgi:hypothetical protein
MKKVKMLKSIAGEDFRLGKGQEIELEDELAIGWESVGVCDILESVSAKEIKRFSIPIKRETMEKGPDETAMKVHTPIEKKHEQRKVEPKKVPITKKKAPVKKKK